MMWSIRPISVAALVLLAGAAASPPPVWAADQDVAELLEGVSEVAAPGVPGPLCVYSDESFPVVVGGSSGAAYEPSVAAGRIGQGRVIVFGHGGYFDVGSLETGDTGRLMSNAVKWSGQSTSPAVGVVGNAALTVWLSDAGFAATDATLDDLGAHDVVFAAPWNQTQSEITALQSYVGEGGGLIAAATGWGWAQLNPGKDLADDYAGNRLLRPFGIQFPYAWLERTSAAGYEVAGPPPELTHAVRALDAVEMASRGERELSGPEREQASVTLLRAATCVPPDSALFRPRLDALVGEAADFVVPSPESPVTSEQTLERVALALQLRRLAGLPPEDVPAHPGSELFPGAVPESAPRVSREVTVDPSVPRWRSTGLYAPPGETVTVRLPDAAIDSGLVLRIGAHTDTLWNSDSWRRVPEIAVAVPLAAQITRAASPFGGLVYIDVPTTADVAQITAQIEGAVEAPLFVLGETDVNDWRSTVRDHLAPWAEVASGTIVVTVPSAVVRDLDDPATLMRTWDRLMDLNANLASWPLARARPERFVVDEQISAGYMHSGYPIMAHLDQQTNVVSTEHLLGGNWGIFHELGHNHQSSHWTFAGTTEVTVNLFTLYAFEHLCAVPVREHARGSEKFVRDQMAKYDFDAPDFEQWKRDPFLALAMYAQLQHAFGWDLFETVFAEYRGLSEQDLPKSDDEKRDQWLMRASRAVGRDLGPFFEAWGVPTSSEARASLSDLPAWMPAGFPDGYDAPSAPPTATATATATAMPTTMPTTMTTATSNATPSATSTRATPTPPTRLTPTPTPPTPTPTGDPGAGRFWLFVPSAAR